MKRALWLFAASSIIASASMVAQDRSANTWYFGSGSGLSFITDPPTVISGGRTNAYEGTAVAADPVTGQVLFYTDGSTVWDGAHTVVKTNVCQSCGSATMAAIVVPHPGRPGTYYLFVTTDETVQPNSQGRVAEVTVNGATVTVANPQVVLTGMTEKVTAAKACNGIDYWVIFKQIDGTFVAFRVTEANGFDPLARVNTPGITPTGNDYSQVRGEMKISPDGKWLACANESNGIELFRFNNATGQLTLMERWGFGTRHYGVSFSPDSRLLYINRGWISNGTREIFQYDLAAASVQASALVIGTAGVGFGPGSMQIAPNGRIYMSKWAGGSGSRNIAVINSPNVRGVGCGYVDNAITFPSSTVAWGLPNFPQNFFVPPLTGNDTTVCAGQPARIGAAPLPGYTYMWTPTADLDDSTSAQPTARVSETTTFQLLATDQFGCQLRQDVTVTALPLPIITVTNDTAICNGTSVRLVATGGATYRWTPVTGLDNPASATPLATPLTSTTYTVEVTGANGCIVIDTVRITLRPETVPTLVRSDTTVCAGQIVRLGRAALAGYGYAWEPASMVDDPASAQPSTVASQTTTYVVRATEPQLGCVIEQRVTVTVLPLPPATVSADTAVCEGTAVQLAAGGGVQYRWTPAASLSDAASATPIASPQISTMYFVDVIGANGCVVTDTVTVTIRDNPEPVLTQRDTTICSCDSIELVAPSGYASYLWSDMRTSQRIMVRAPGTYSVRTTDQFGCYGTSNSVRIDTMIATANMDIALSRTSARDGATVSLTVTMRGSREVARCLGDTIRVRLGLTPSVLVPIDEVMRSMHPLLLEEYIDVDMVMPTPTRDTLQFVIPCTVTLGKAEAADIAVNSVTSDGCQALVTNGTATFTLDEICRIGGIPRFFYDGAIEGIVAIVEPNPASDVATLRVLTLQQRPLTITVSDVTGRVIRTIDDSVPSGWSRIPIPLDGIANGLYLVRVMTSSGSVTSMLQVQQ